MWYLFSYSNDLIKLGCYSILTTIGNMKYFLLSAVRRNSWQSTYGFKYKYFLHMFPT